MLCQKGADVDSVIKVQDDEEGNRLSSSATMKNEGQTPLYLAIKELPEDCALKVNTT